MTQTDYGSAVALIGMSGRFPGASSVDQLWRNLLAGVKGLRELTDEEMIAAGVEPGQLANPNYVRIGGPLEDIERFDAALFGISPREAEMMEPQHKLFLECTWEALEAAGYCPTDMPGQVGVFAGCGFPDYLVKNIVHLASERGNGLVMAVGNERDSLTSLVSYKLGLRGPAVSVQTFCSTSLVAVHMACQSLLTYECDVALAGGAFTPLPQPAGYLYEPGVIRSPDGWVRSFDAAANGTVMGSGAGAVALKRMSEAIADGDLIHAVILGSAVNNDGRLRAGYTAPGVEGQAEVIEAALGVAGVKPETIGYVECHATGTMLGDSIELAAIGRAFTRPRQQPCVLGSVKPSIGHLDRASGVTGLIRATMNLKNRLLPGTPNYESPNPALATALDRFTVLTEHHAWPDGEHPRRAGVNSFGLGGTNAHVVLEEAPAAPVCTERPGPHLLLFSASEEQALTELTQRLHTHLAEHPEPLHLADVAYTLQVSRGGFALRRAVVCRDREDAVVALADPARWIDGKTQRRNPRVLLTAPEDAADGWWPRLHDAATALGAAAGGPADRAGALDALAEVLTRLGVRVQRAADGTEDETVIAVPDGAGVTDAGEWLLAVLARLWLAGASIDWPALHDGAGRRVQLPTYPFQRRRCWIEARKRSGAPVAPVSSGRTFDRSQWTYLPTWRPRPLPLAGLDERLREAGPWLVFTDDARGEALVQRLNLAGAEVIAVRAGAEFTQQDSGDFTVRVGQPDDLAELMYSLLVAPRAIVHGFSLASPVAEADPVAHFEAEQRRGFYSVLGLTRELVDNSGSAPRAELVLLTCGAVSVSGADLSHPEHATMAAIAPSLAQENPRLRSRHIDVDEAGAEATEDVLAAQATQVLAAAVCDYEGPVAVRGGETWQRRYDLFPTPELDQQQRPIRDGDTVLITGGLGDVGLTLARHLASRYACRLVLTARSPLPPREQWPQFLEAVANRDPATVEKAGRGDDRVARHLRNILDLQARGATVLARSADVADPEQMRAVVDEAVEHFGGIDVVVHAAGVQDSRFFNFAHLMDRAQHDAHLAAKIKGFLVLQQVLGQHAIDRRITLSSLAAVLGGLTLVPYAAANAGLDAYARLARRRGGGRWITVDWDTWNIDPDRVEGHSTAVTEFAMSPAEGIDIFERTLASADRVPQLVISTGSLDARITQWVIGDIHQADDDYDDDRERHPRPDLNSPYVPPREGVERTLADIWERVLRIEQIGATDNFFELGGHSLIAIELTTRIRRALDAAIPVTGLLECPTVRDLATLIESSSAQSSSTRSSPAQSSAAESCPLAS